MCVVSSVVPAAETVSLCDSVPSRQPAHWWGSQSLPRHSHHHSPTVTQSHSSTLPVCLVMVDVQESDNSEQAQLVTVHGRLGSVTFKPYRDIKTRTVTTVGEQADTASCLTVDSLYPEILCHVFSYLDTSSKGRAAQVIMNESHQLSLKDSQNRATFLAFAPIASSAAVLGLHPLAECPQHEGDLARLRGQTPPEETDLLRDGRAGEERNQEGPGAQHQEVLEGARDWHPDPHQPQPLWLRRSV